MSRAGVTSPQPNTSLKQGFATSPYHRLTPCARWALFLTRSHHGVCLFKPITALSTASSALVSPQLSVGIMA